MRDRSQHEGWAPASSGGRFDLAVVALSARALARSAKRAGLKALAIDLFADADTNEHAALAVRCKESRVAGFHGGRLLDALREHAPAGLPVVLGAGFEHAPKLMRAIARRNPIVGASPETVARLKDPFAFAALLADLDVPHPAVKPTAAHLSPAGRGLRAAPGEGVSRDPERFSPPRPLGFADRPLPTRERWTAASRALDSSGDAYRWLSKRAGASGGAHIRVGVDGARQRRYLQAQIEGRSVSALFLADGHAARILGVSEQWADPTPRAPFRYGGAAGPVELPASLTAAIAVALDRIVAAIGLVGLASADLVEAGDRFSLLEINPRPGATLDVFDHGDMPSLVGLHLASSAGRLPDVLPVASEVRAAAIVYADRPLRAKALQRPVWTADWPSCDETVPAGSPFCTILATGPSPSTARTLLERRRADLLSAIRAAQAPAATNRKKAHA